jgi:hypothetical protein
MGVIIGVLLMFLGITIFFAFPVSAPWELRSDVLVEGKTLVVSPGSSEHLSEGPFFSWGEDYLARGYVLKGDAIETGDHEFNFYVLDSDNYTAWDNGKVYTAYYEEKGVESTSFDVSLAEGEGITFYFVVENPSSFKETVRVSAKMEYQVKLMGDAIIKGILVGGSMGLIGFIILIISLITHFLWKPDED